MIEKRKITTAAGNLKNGTDDRNERCNKNNEKVQKLEKNEGESAYEEVSGGWKVRQCVDIYEWRQKWRADTFSELQLYWEMLREEAGETVHVFT